MTTIGQIVMTFGTDFHGAQRKNLNDLRSADSSLEPPACQSFHLSFQIFVEVFMAER